MTNKMIMQMKTAGNRQGNGMFARLGLGIRNGLRNWKVNRLSRTLRNETNLKKYDKAATKLAKTGDEKAVAVLTEGVRYTGLGFYLCDAIKDKRFYAAMALASMGEKALPVLTNLLEDTDDNVRLNAVYGLREMGKRAAPSVPALCIALKTDQYDDVRRQIIWVLSDIGGPEARKALLAACTDKNAHIAGEAWRRFTLISE